MKKAHLKQIIEALTEELIQIKAAYKLTEQVLNKKILSYKEKLEEEKKRANMWRQSYTVDGRKLEMVKKCLEKVSKEKDALQHEFAQLKHQLKNQQ
tara:strand:+ start:636 stop:923 length:288 start_codon:yes stop_codon:yes gene_type:complete